MVKCKHTWGHLEIRSSTWSAGLLRTEALTQHIHQTPANAFVHLTKHTAARSNRVAMDEFSNCLHTTYHYTVYIIYLHMSALHVPSHTPHGMVPPDGMVLIWLITPTPTQPPITITTTTTTTPPATTTTATMSATATTTTTASPPTP